MRSYCQILLLRYLSLSPTACCVGYRRHEGVTESGEVYPGLAVLGFVAHARGREIAAKMPQRRANIAEFVRWRREVSFEALVYATLRLWFHHAEGSDHTDGKCIDCMFLGHNLTTSLTVDHYRCRAATCRSRTSFSTSR